MISNVFGYLVPRERIDAYRFPYNSFSWERDGALYDKIKVRRWKNRVPDMSKYLDFLYPKAIFSRPTASQIRASGQNDRRYRQQQYKWQQQQRRK